MALTSSLIKLTNELLHRIFILPSYSGHSLHRQSTHQLDYFGIENNHVHVRWYLYFNKPLCIGGEIGQLLAVRNS